VKGVGIVLLALVAVIVAAESEHAVGAVSRCTRTFVSRATFSADSKWVAVSRQRDCDVLPSVVVIGANGRGLRTIGRDVIDWRWSPKTDRIAFEPVTNGASSLSVATTTGRRVLHVPDATAFTWSPSGRELAVRRRGSEDIAVAPIGGALRSVAQAPLGNYRLGHALEWAPDGGSILFTTSGDGPSLSIRVVGRGGQGEREIARGRSPDWSPEGSRIAYDTAPSPIHPASTGAAPAAWVTVGPDGSDPRAVGPSSVASSSQWASRGQWLSFTVPGQTVSETWVDAPTGGALLDLGAGTPVWSSSGTRLALVSAQITLVDADGTHRVVLPFGGEVAWAPGGGRIAVGGTRVYVVQASGRKAKAVARGGAPAWSPDGRLIAFLRQRPCGQDLYVLRLSPRRLRRLVRCG
jgi:Tol biopolymer transport system component